MKRMIDYKEFQELQQLANNNEQRLDIDEQRLDHIEGAYTYSALSLDDANFDHLLPSAAQELSPQTLEIGDTVYFEGVATTLDADMIKEIFDSNLVILDCGAAPTSYPTVFLQRQYVDEGSDLVSPRNARFKAFVTYGVTLYEYTMTVAEYDATAQAGGYIVISCKEAHTKPVYCHPITMAWASPGTNVQYAISGMIFNNSSAPIDSLTKLGTWFQNLYSSLNTPIRFNLSGGYHVTDVADIPVVAYLFYDGTNYTLIGTDDNGYIQTVKPSLAALFTGTSTINDGVNRIN